MASWDDILTGVDRALYDIYADSGPQKGLGKKPAVIVVDVNYAFVGLKPEPILESVKTFPSSCGDTGWEAIPRIQSLLAVAREAGIPIIYSTSVDNPMRGAGWGNRYRDGQGLEFLDDEELEKRRIGNTIVKEIEPHPHDIVLYKRAASVFSDTPLLTYLNELDVDTLLVAGTTTSGCVHATVVDGGCADFYVGIVEECVFDRFTISHKAALLNMHLKYGVVMSLADTLEYMNTGAEATLPAKKPSVV